MMLLYVMNKRLSLILTREQLQEPFMKLLRSKFKIGIITKLFILFKELST